MARKRVLIVALDGSIEHTTHRGAFLLVQKQEADWVEEYKSIVLLDKKVVPRGMNHTNFDDVWGISRSEVMPVWQVRKGALAGVL